MAGKSKILQRSYFISVRQVIFFFPSELAQAENRCYPKQSEFDKQYP